MIVAINFPIEMLSCKMDYNSFYASDSLWLGIVLLQLGTNSVTIKLVTIERLRLNVESSLEKYVLLILSSCLKYITDKA